MANQTQSDLMSNDKIIETVTLSVVEKDSYEGTPPTYTLEQIQAFTAEAPGNDWVVFVLEQPRGSRYDAHSISEDTKRLELARRIMLQRSTREPTEMSAEEQIWAMANILHKGTTPEHLRQDFYKVDPTHFEPIAKFITRTAGEPTPERLQWLHKAWDKWDKAHMNIPHPLALICRAMIQEQTHRTIQTATVDHVQNLSTVPYVVSEVNRRKWEIEGSVDAIEVDGEPIITYIKQLPGTFSADVTVLKPKGTQGELRPMPTQRNNMEIPAPLVAYQKYGHNLGSPIASDVAQLMTIAYAANEILKLSVKEGASLLARGEDGAPRSPRDSDEQRFENAYACLGMAIWITDERGIDRFYPLMAHDRLSGNRFEIAAAGWARDRQSGRWTLTAGGGVAGQNRLKGDAHNNNIGRVITGIEYWLARDRFPSKGQNARISQALIPATGTTGPGNWHTLLWRELMMIAGDVWDCNDKGVDWKIRQRFYGIRDALKKYGYQVKKLHTPAAAGDTVEFLFEKRGKVKVRATSRFVEGARKAKREDWQKVGLSDFLGL